MDNGKLATIHEGLDKILESTARELSAEGESKPIDTERDTAIIMVCAALAKSEIPAAKTEDEYAFINRSVLTEFLENIASDAGSKADVLERLSELAYEYDDELAGKFRKLSREIRKGDQGDAQPGDLAESEIAAPEFSTHGAAGESYPLCNEITPTGPCQKPRGHQFRANDPEHVGPPAQPRPEEAKPSETSAPEFNGDQEPPDEEHDAGAFSEGEPDD